MKRLLALMLAAFVWVALPGLAAAQDDHDEPAAAAEDHGHDDAHSEEGGVNPVAVDPDLAWFTFAVFLALAALLRAVAWDPIVKALNAREEGIAGEIAAAEATHEEAKALLAEHQAKIAAATDDVKEMLEEARRDAEATKAEIVAEARDAADAEKARAIREVEHARDAAIKGLAEESANLAIDLASKIVKQEISAERQGEIVRDAIGRLASAEPSSN